MPRSVVAAVVLVIGVAVGVGIWAEFDDLGQPQLIAVAVPVILIATATVVFASRASARARAVGAVVAGALSGLMLLGGSEGLYLALHYARGGTVNFEGFDSEPAQALALLSVHSVVGLLGGAMVGAAVAAAVVVLAGGRWDGVRRARARTPK